jgi:hypothetical protein
MKNKHRKKICERNNEYKDSVSQADCFTFRIAVVIICDTSEVSNNV